MKVWEINMTPQRATCTNSGQAEEDKIRAELHLRLTKYHDRRRRRKRKVTSSGQIFSKFESETGVCEGAGTAQWYTARLRTGMIEGLSPGKGWEFFSSPPCPDRLCVPPSLLSNGYQGLFPWG
jgi:hypothetical protein